MTLNRSLVLAAALCAAASGARAQEFQMPKPGPEHELLKKDVGTWDATVEILMPPAPPSKGVETNTLGPGGLWLIGDFKSEMMGAPFQGHGVTGYNPFKKKYVGTWVDSMSPGLSTTEGTYDPKTKTMTTWIEGPNPDGSMMKMRTTSEWKGSDTRVFTMYAPTGPDKEFPALKITYKRRAAAASREAK